MEFWPSWKKDGWRNNIDWSCDDIKLNYFELMVLLALGQKEVNLKTLKMYCRVSHNIRANLKETNA